MYQFGPELISRMKTVAKEHTLFVGKQIVPNQPCLWEDVSYKDISVNLILTYEVLEQKEIKIWHLSIINSDESLVPQQIANEIAYDFLGGEAKELPQEIMPKELRISRKFVVQA